MSESYSVVFIDLKSEARQIYCAVKTTIDQLWRRGDFQMIRFEVDSSRRLPPSLFNVLVVLRDTSLLKRFTDKPPRPEDDLQGGT